MSFATESSDQVVAPDNGRDAERTLAEASFVTSLAQFFLSTDLRLTDRRLLARAPHTALGLIPTGSEKLTLPLHNVAAVGTSFRVGILKLPLGVLIVLFGLVGLGAQAFGTSLVILLIGLALTSAGLRTVIWVEATSGRRLELPILFVQRGRAQQLAEQINLAIGQSVRR